MMKHAITCDLDDDCTCNDPQAIGLNPHHPECSYPNGSTYFVGHDPERCCYCAALIRSERDPLDFRYGGPKCYCGKE